MKPYYVAIQMKATERYFPVVLFIMPYKVVLPFESVGEILKCDHSNESYWAVLSCGTVYYAVQGGSNFWVCGWNAVVWPFKWNFFSITFTMSCLFFSILQREIWNFCWILTLATPGSKRATSFSQLTTHLPSKFLDVLFNISIHNHLVLWKFKSNVQSP